MKYDTLVCSTVCLHFLSEVLLVEIFRRNPSGITLSFADIDKINFFVDIRVNKRRGWVEGLKKTSKIKLSPKKQVVAGDELEKQ